MLCGAVEFIILLFDSVFISLNALGDDNATLDIETAFFQVEHEMELGICREQICLSEGKEKGNTHLQNFHLIHTTSVR